MSMRRSGEHGGHEYRCWIEPSQGRYRAWYRGKMNLESGQTNLVDRLHGSTDWHEDKEAALDEAEARIKAIFDEIGGA
jgi:hypothetical protein